MGLDLVVLVVWLGCKVLGFRFRFQSLGALVEGSGFRFQG